MAPGLGGEYAECFIEDSHDAIFRMVGGGVGGSVQKALFKISAKRCLECLIMLDDS